MGADLPNGLNPMLTDPILEPLAGLFTVDTSAPEGRAAMRNALARLGSGGAPMSVARRKALVRRALGDECADLIEAYLEKLR